ncbi:metallophosphoesterase [Legionella adelaidensis]|nr:metallophosphoesterase [Legionella adelaidensis]
MRILSFLLLFISFSVFADTQFLVITDIHFDKAISHPSSESDAGVLLLDSAMKKLTELSKNVDFIITLGDFPGHTFFNSVKRQENISTVFHSLFLANIYSKPFFYIAGNNDSLSGNYQAFQSKKGSPLSLAKDWQGSCLHCTELMIDDSSMQEYGYYSTYVMKDNKDIILIALNSVLFAKLPFYIPKPPHQNENAIHQLQWFEEQIKNHTGKQLLIAMHIPPGLNNHDHPLWEKAYVKKFIQILDTYSSHFTEVTLLTAHTHMDEIRKIVTGSNLGIYAFSTPSISRIHANNAAMKVFTLNANYQITNYRTYYAEEDEKWENLHYDAINPNKGIFPCRGQTLASCLNNLEVEEVCNHLDREHFYSAKSKKSGYQVCKKTFLVEEH